MFYFKSTWCKIYRIVLLFFLIFFIKVNSQNKQLLYGFKDVPQSLMLNPGSEVVFKKHIGVPLLSGLSFKASTNGFTFNYFLTNDGRSLTEKVQDLIVKIPPHKSGILNQQLELINVGYNLDNEKGYLNFGIYQELDLMSYHPKDVTSLYYFGNNNEFGNEILNIPYNMSQLNIKGELLSVFHLGLSKRINKKLTLGGRLKLYSSGYNITSARNTGELTTVKLSDNQYQHQLRNFDLTVRSSGLEKGYSKGFMSNTIKKTFFSGNLGIGFDAGATYRLAEDVILTASLLDIGFVTQNSNVRTTKLKGNHDLNDIGLLDPSSSSESREAYWSNLIDNIREDINIEKITTSYVTMRPIKFNTALSYQFGKEVQRMSDKDEIVCTQGIYDIRYRENEIGAQLYSVYRLKKPQMAFTVYYYRSIAKFLRTKISYTLDSYSSKNIGLGISSQFKGANFYFTLDNLLNFRDLTKAQSVSAQFGFNFIVD